MLKTKFLVVFFVAIAIVFCSSITFAKNDKNSDIPEQAGLYDVPGHPELKLRVFVYHEKPNKPGKPTPPSPKEVCNLSDPDSDLLVASAEWKLSGTWKYRLNTSSVPLTIGANNLSMIAENSYKQWTDVIHNNQVTITKDSDTIVNRAVLDGQNIITWGNAPGSALAVSYIWYDRITKVATEVDTIMNTKSTWYWSQNQNCAYQGVYDAQDILTHELGHTMGLDDMYTDEYANHTMYGYGSKGEVKKDTLTQGDISGVQQIYH
jgi:hypothetical protein